MLDNNITVSTYKIREMEINILMKLNNKQIGNIAWGHWVGDEFEMQLQQRSKRYTYNCNGYVIG